MTFIRRLKRGLWYLNTKTFHIHRLQDQHKYHALGSRLMGGRISYYFLTWYWSKKIIGLLIFSQLSLGFMILLLLSLGYSLDHLITHNGLSSWFNWFPWTFSNIVTFVEYLWAFSFGWTILVTINHWNDVATLVSQAGLHDFSSWIAAATAYVWTVNIDMAEQFIRVLISEPTKIFNTRAIAEIQLTVDTIEGFGRLLTETILYYAPHWFNPLLNLIQSVTSYIWGNVISGLGFCVKWGWTHLIDGISNVITPTVHPTLQPYVNGIFQGVASSLGTALVLWIIKLLFNFPFL